MHCVPLAGLCLSVYSLHVLNRDVNIIQILNPNLPETGGEYFSGVENNHGERSSDTKLGNQGDYQDNGIQICSLTTCWENDFENKSKSRSLSDHNEIICRAMGFAKKH